MKAAILAGGEGARFEGDTIKPLMVVCDGRPVILDALYALSNMAFSDNEVCVVVNERNDAAIREVIGNSAVKNVLQKENAGPTAAVKAAFEAQPDTEELLVIQADDSHWLTPILPDFARGYDRRVKAQAAMALSLTADPGVHHSTYLIDADSNLIGYQSGIGLPQSKNPRMGYNNGAYVVKRDQFLPAFTSLVHQAKAGRNLNSTNVVDVGIPAAIQFMHDRGVSVFAPVYDYPFKSANTTLGLEAARQIAAATLDVPGNHLATVAETIKFTQPTS